jgi:hypothetical protein
MKAGPSLFHKKFTTLASSDKHGKELRSANYIFRRFIPSFFRKSVPGGNGLVRTGFSCFAVFREAARAGGHLRQTAKRVRALSLSARPEGCGLQRLTSGAGQTRL